MLLPSPRLLRDKFSTSLSISKLSQPKFLSMVDYTCYRISVHVSKLITKEGVETFS